MSASVLELQAMQELQVHRCNSSKLAGLLEAQTSVLWSLVFAWCKQWIWVKWNQRKSEGDADL